jgi:hypothetical protein
VSASKDGAEVLTATKVARVGFPPPTEVRGLSSCRVLPVIEDKREFNKVNQITINLAYRG